MAIMLSNKGEVGRAIPLFYVGLILIHLVADVQANCEVDNLKFDELRNKLIWKRPTCAEVDHYLVALKNSLISANLKTSVEEQRVLPAFEYGNGTVFVVDMMNNITSIGRTVEFVKVGEIPGKPTEEAEKNVTGTPSVEYPDQSITISFPPELFRNEKILYWTIFLSTVKGESFSGFTIEEDTPLTWAAARQGKKDWYQPTRGTQQFQNDTSSIQYISGDENCAYTSLKDYCNGVLLPDTKYWFKIRGYTKVGFVDSEPHDVTTAKPPSQVGIMVALLTVLSVIGAIVFTTIFARQNNISLSCAKIVTYQVAHQTTSIKMRQNLEIAVKERASQLSPKDIPKSKFAECLDVLKRDDEEELINQFEELDDNESILPPPATHPQNYSAAMNQYNRHKNRYFNVLPADSTRVVMSALSASDPESDYINASLINGVSGAVEYIASQGPRKNTTEDFWRMVYEKDVKVVAMLTKFEEGGKEKCYRYFPILNKEIKFEKMDVKCDEQSDCLTSYIKRTFQVQMCDSVPKTVVHLHFHEWPDHGSPETTELLLTFCKALRENIDNCNGGLAVIHCSAGVGRTGTLIALDMLMQLAKQKDYFNIFETVLQLRRQRIMMVQTVEQYIFIHECLKDFIEAENIEGKPKLPAQEMNINSKIDSFRNNLQPLKPCGLTSGNEILNGIKLLGSDSRNEWNDYEPTYSAVVNETVVEEFDECTHL